jgi:UDP-glucose 4-epimerase
MNIVVTGGAGYIGSVLVRRLTEKGHSVTVIDDLSTGHRDAIPESVRFIEGSVGNIEHLLSKEDTIDAVVHLAGSISVAESVKNPQLYWDNNFTQTLQMLQGMQAHGIDKLVFASTAAVYGNPVEIPIQEDAPKNPTNPYGMSKLAMDMAITSYAHAYGLAATSVRFFNVAGAYKDAGERHPNESHLIPLAFDAAVDKRTLSLYGSDYETPDGTCVRDYIHVLDLADAIELSLHQLKPSTHSIYNLGNGNGFSNKELVEAVQSATGTNFAVNKEARRDGDPAWLVASSQLAKQELGWEPVITSLHDIISDAWRFYNR